MSYLGIDVGTTHITALALDAESGAILASQAVLNSTQTTSPADKARGRSEWDAQAMIELAWEALRRVVVSLPDPQAVRGIGLSGQMHGMCLLSADLKSLTPFIGWQDRRGDDLMPGVKRTYLLRAIELADKLPRARIDPLLVEGDRPPVSCGCARSVHLGCADFLADRRAALRRSQQRR
jgi:sugar (pentulose or hexulose) kinase